MYDLNEAICVSVTRSMQMLVIFNHYSYLRADIITMCDSPKRLLCGVMVSASVSRSKGPEFDSRCWHRVFLCFCVDVNTFAEFIPIIRIMQSSNSSFWSFFWQENSIIGVFLNIMQLTTKSEWYWSIFEFWLIKKGRIRDFQRLFFPESEYFRGPEVKKTTYSF